MAEKPQNRWSDSLATQIPVIDSQHRGLFDLAYEVDCALEAGQEEVVIRQVIERLKQYCQYHFIAEERLMHEYGYPHLHAHLLQHDEFTRTVIELEAQQALAPKTVAGRTAAFLKDWLSEHIGVEDQKYVPFVLRQTGAQEAQKKGVPMLLETEAATKDPDTALCARVAGLLMQQGLRPVGLAASLEQTRAILKEMEALELKPAIYVVNTCGAKDLLRELDSLMGEVPVLYLRRALFAGQSGLLDQYSWGDPGSVTATVVLGNMRARLTSMWFYGARNADRIAQRAAEAIGAFLKTGDFRQIERLRPAK